MRFSQRVTELPENLQRLRGRQELLALDALGQLLAVEQLHRQPGNSRVVVDAGRNDLDHVVAADPRAHLRFLREPRPRIRALDELRVHDLERPLAPGGELLDEVHRAHAARRQRLQDPEVLPEDLPLLELRKVGIHQTI